MAEVYDGFTGLPLGMNATKDPFLLPEGQCARAINVTFRGGLARTRPGFVLEVVELPEGTLQGVGRWALETGDVLVFVTGQEDVQATCELLAENLDTIRETDVEVRSRSPVHEKQTYWRQGKILTPRNWEFWLLHD